MIAALFICACAAEAEAELPSEVLPAEERTAAVIVTIETEKEESEEEELFEAGSFAYYCQKIEHAALEYGVDPALAIAISRLETGNFTSKAFIGGYNFGGLTGTKGVMRFASEEEGLRAYMECLSWYKEKGMDTPDKMRKVYCPGSSKWSDLVKKIMKEHKQEVGR